MSNGALRLEFAKESAHILNRREQVQSPRYRERLAIDRPRRCLTRALRSPVPFLEYGGVLLSQRPSLLQDIPFFELRRTSIAVRKAQYGSAGARVPVHQHFD